MNEYLLQMVRQFMKRSQELQTDEQWRRLELEHPTHYVETQDGKLGAGMSFAEAFSDLVAETALTRI